MRIVLAGVCGFTIAASSWLAAMALVLRRPGYQVLVGLASLFVLQSLVTMVVISEKLAWKGARAILAGGATSMVVAGGQAIAVNLTRPHFEGYAVIIGVVLIIQGLLTLWSLYVRRPPASAEVHRFGK
jgi:hypothetical protein